MKNGGSPGWHKHSREHSLAAHGIKSRNGMKAKGNMDFSEKEIYQYEDLIEDTQRKFKKTFPGYTLTKADIKWFLSQLWKNYKEDYIKDDWESEIEAAKDEWRDEMADYREDAKEMGEKFEKTPFAEWFSDNYGYSTKLKDYIEINKYEISDSFSGEVEDADLQDYFEVFKEKFEGKTYRYVERLG